MILDFIDLMPGQQSDMDIAVENIKKMSDEELINIVYVIRKVLRHCVYNTSNNSIKLIGDFNEELIDSYSIMVYSKLLSLIPYKSKEEVREGITKVIKWKGGVQ